MQDVVGQSKFSVDFESIKYLSMSFEHWMEIYVSFYLLLSLLPRRSYKQIRHGRHRKPGESDVFGASVPTLLNPNAKAAANEC